MRKYKKEVPSENPIPNIKQKLSHVLDLPEEILMDLPKLTAVGNRELVIENYKGIVEYTETFIRINTASVSVKVSGRSLEISTIVAEEITICGTITAIEFIP